MICVLLTLFTLPTAAALAAVSARCRTARKAAFVSHSDSKQFMDVPMEIMEGELPSWLEGIYLRNGPGMFEVGDRRLEHWFDGYGLLTRVCFKSGSVPLISTNFVDSSARQAACRGKMQYAEFMTPLTAPGAGLLSALNAAFAIVTGDPTDNACVNVVCRTAGKTEVMTETQRSWFEIDPQTLATLRRTPWAGDAVGQLSTAHAQPDPRGGGWINVGTEISPPFSSRYHIFRLDDQTPQERKRLASIPCSNPAAPCWMHSFGVTENAVVVLEQPATYSVGAMLGLAKASHGSIDWDESSGMRLHVLNRTSGSLRTHTLERPFFFFHIANAFDVEDGGVALDICAFDDPEIVTALRLDRLKDDALVRDLPSSRLVRLTIPPPGQRTRSPTVEPLDDIVATGHFCDLPTISPRVRGAPFYRFVYGIGASRPAAVSNRLVKIDTRRAGGDAFYEVDGMLPGEPLFIARPGGEDEDDGICMSLATDADGGTSLYILDARTMTLVVRCRSPVAIPAGFHGEWVGAS